MWLGNLPPSIVEESLIRFCSTFGEVQNLFIPKERDTGWSKGYAFVEFGTEESVAELLKKMDGQSFLGRRIVARRARPRTA